MNAIFVKSIHTIKVNDLADLINKTLRQRFQNACFTGVSPEELIKALDKELDELNDQYPRSRPYHAYIHKDPTDSNNIAININNCGMRQSTCCKLQCYVNPREYFVSLYDQKLTTVITES